MSSKPGQTALINIRGCCNVCVMHAMTHLQPYFQNSFAHCWKSLISDCFATERKLYLKDAAFSVSFKCILHNRRFRKAWKIPCGTDPRKSKFHNRSLTSVTSHTSDINLIISDVLNEDTTTQILDVRLWICVIYSIQPWSSSFCVSVWSCVVILLLQYIIMDCCLQDVYLTLLTLLARRWGT